MPVSETPPVAHPFDWDELRQRLQAATQTLTGSRVSVDDRAVLVERARQLAESQIHSEQYSELLDVVQFVISGEHYAVESSVIQEVIAHPELTPIPNTPKFLKGIYNLRGEVLAVIDLRSFLNIPISDPITRWLLVIGDETAEFGIVADQVHDVHRLRLDAILRPSLSSTPGGALIRGVTAEAVVLLDSEALLTDPKLSVDISATA